MQSKRLYRVRDDNKSSFNHMFQKFCDEIKFGNADELTQMLYGRFDVECFEYSDDCNWYTVEQYLLGIVIPHKIEVFNAGVEIYKQLSPLYSIDKSEFIDNLWTHDLSKFSAKEALGYSQWSFSTQRGNKQIFSSAWNHHKNHNPHHPEYWLSVDRGGSVEDIKMPNIFVAEMVADWIGAGQIYGSAIKDWLPNNLHKFKLHTDTSICLQGVLMDIGIKTKFERGVLLTDF